MILPEELMHKVLYHFVFPNTSSERERHICRYGCERSVDFKYIIGYAMRVNKLFRNELMRLLHTSALKSNSFNIRTHISSKCSRFESRHPWKFPFYLQHNNGDHITIYQVNRVERFVTHTNCKHPSVRMLRGNFMDMTSGALFSESIELKHWNTCLRLKYGVGYMRVGPSGPLLLESVLFRKLMSTFNRYEKQSKLSYIECSYSL